ncbi:hypothetical protein ACE41H_20195 [Paenibacillus enshidis]|uniref:Uncharacterized protein n=1 Tax=Paenibacillus enshidis TaxID=1458439 RepID=A0ABV5AYX8_9BACL
MSYPTIPNITPTITVDHSGAVNLLLVSMAMEEISLSHIINAEAENIQHVVGTLHGTGTAASIDDILKVSKGVRQTLTEVVRKELLLQMKLETVLSSISPGSNETPTYPPDPTSGEGTFNTTYR